MGGYYPKEWKYRGKLHFFLWVILVLVFVDVKNDSFGCLEIWCGTMSLAEVRLSCVRTYAPPTAVCFFAVTSITLSLQTHRKTHIFSRLSSAFSFLSKTDGLFSSNRRLVFFKPTGHFSWTNRSFYKKVHFFCPFPLGVHNTLVASTTKPPNFAEKTFFRDCWFAVFLK